MLRRATRALTRDPTITAAMVTALSSPGSEAATAKHEVYDILRAIISSAVDGAEVPDLDGIVRVLGYVWLATLSAWVGGMIDPEAMAADLTIAAHLLLRSRHGQLSSGRTSSPRMDPLSGSEESTGPTMSHRAPTSR